jgi:hypothetical protein
MSEWAEIFKLDQNTLRQRLVYGWSVSRALTVPIRKISQKQN